MSFAGGSDGKEFTCNAGDQGSIPGSSLGEGNGNPLWYSCLENLMDRGAWWATVYGVTKSQIRLSSTTRHGCDGVGKWLHMLPNACCIVFKKKVAPGIRDSEIAEGRWLREDSNLVALWAMAHVKSSASTRTVMITCLPTHPRALRASHNLWMKLIQRTKIMKKEAEKEESLGGKKIFQMQWYLSD